MPVKFKNKCFDEKESEFTEKDILSTNYLTSVDYLFKATKEKRLMIEN